MEDGSLRVSRVGIGTPRESAAEINVQEFASPLAVDDCGVAGIGIFTCEAGAFRGKA